VYFCTLGHGSPLNSCGEMCKKCSESKKICPAECSFIQAVCQCPKKLADENLADVKYPSN